MHPVRAIVAGLVLGVVLVAEDRAEAPKMRPVWTGPDVSLLGGPSRDGRALSFVDRATGNLALRSIADGSVRFVTAKGPNEDGQFAYFSTLAPNGHQTAFAWFNEAGFYELRLADSPQADGKPGHVRTLYRNAEAGFVQPCAFSPDGSKILTLFFRRDNISQIALVSTADGSVTTLRSLNWIYPKRMDFSPDGRFIVYDNASAEGAAERDLFLLAADGSKETRLLSGPHNDLFPMWSPGGGEILFSSDRGGSPGLWALPVENGAATGEARLIRGDLGRFLPLGVTADGDVLLGRRRGGVEIHVASLDAAKDGPSNDDRVFPAPPETDVFAPAFSPDEDRMAFIARVRSENFGQEHRTLVIRSLSHQKDEEIDARMAHIERVSWSPDALRLLLEGSDHRGRGGVFVYDLATRRTSVAALDPHPGLRGLHAAYGAGGEIIFARGAVLVEKSAEGGEERVLYAAEAGRLVLLPAIAPAGRGRAFIVAPEDGEGGSLYAELPGRVGRSKLLDLPSGRFTDLAWTPSGDALVVGTAGKQGAQLWRVSIAGDSMTAIPTAAGRIPGVSIHPSGRAVAYAAGVPSEEVWIVEHAVKGQSGVDR